MTEKISVSSNWSKKEREELKEKISDKMKEKQKELERRKKFNETLVFKALNLKRLNRLINFYQELIDYLNYCSSCFLEDNRRKFEDFIQI